MIQKLIEKLNKKRLKERISSAIVMVALIVSISGVVGAVSGIVVSNRYNYALKNYGFSQGDIGKMMITFADTRSYLRAAIGYQDENLVNSCAENYEKKKSRASGKPSRDQGTLHRRFCIRKTDFGKRRMHWH